MSRPGDSHIHTALVYQEAQAAFQLGGIVTSHTADDNDVLLSALESINSVDLYVRKLGTNRAQPRGYRIFQQLYLGLVRRNNAYLSSQSLESLLVISS